MCKSNTPVTPFTCNRACCICSYDTVEGTPSINICTDFLNKIKTRGNMNKESPILNMGSIITTLVIAIRIPPNITPTEPMISLNSSNLAP